MNATLSDSQSSSFESEDGCESDGNCISLFDKADVKKKPLVNSLDGEVIGNTDVELSGSSNDEIEGPKDLQNCLQCLT